MTMIGERLASVWTRVAPNVLPFADVANSNVSLGRFLRLSLFQISAGISVVLLTGTLNRVMIVELAVPAGLVALLVSLPLLFAPLRTLIGYGSDHYRSVLGWRRVPFMWFGTLLQFGGLAILPFALLFLSGDTTGPLWVGKAAAALSFLLIGIGLHTTQTSGLALATDLATDEARPRVVALLFAMLLVGMMISALAFAWLLIDFSQVRLIQVIQGAALITFFVNVVSLWKQEPRSARSKPVADRPSFAASLRALQSDRRAVRLLVGVALGTAGFAMQDVLLEPFGGQVLDLSVGGTTALTALLAGGMLVAFVVAARRLQKGMDALRLAGYGALLGIAAFVLLSFVSAAKSELLFATAVALVGFSNGLFAVSTLTAVMDIAAEHSTGFALGAWGAVQATAAGLAIAAGGVLRDIFAALSESGAMGSALVGEAVGYILVYQFEVVLLFATLATIGPLAAFAARADTSERWGISEFPG